MSERPGLVRHLLAVLALPFVVTVVVPHLLLREAPRAPVALALRLVGAVLVAAGLALGAWCVALFARVGRGTLAPWDPTRRLVVAGPYRHTRNPMITGVLTILVGEALLFASARLAWWAALFFVVNQSYFLLLEEPGLVVRFGEEYEAYRRAVPRWLPRRRGWSR